MTNFVSVIGILFCLHFVSFPCRGAISIVNGGDVRYAVPGENVTIEWSLGTSPSNALIRGWTFISTRSETIARIIDDREEEIPTSSLAGVKVEKPATLILNNVNERYNGTYRFQFTVNSGLQQASFVSLFIAAKATVTINCSSSTIVDEGSDVRCLCKGEGGNPPANVIWYKDGKLIGVAADEEKMLTLSSIGKKASGSYKCVAQSYTLKNEESIDIFVYYPPEKPVFFGIPKIVEVGKAFVMICCANALPAPSVTIMHNTTVISANYNYIFINVAEYKHAGSYKCIAKNKLGTSSKDFNLVVVGKD